MQNRRPLANEPSLWAFGPRWLGASPWVAALLASSLIVACAAGDGLSDSNEGDGATHGDSAPGARDGSAGDGDLSIDLAGCSETCAAGTFCSVSGQCIADGTCTENTDCEGGRVCTAGSCEVGGECGSSEFELTSVSPNLLLILDRSCSMGTSANGKWPQAVEAITNLTSAFADDVRFGLELYPDGTPDAGFEDNCTLDTSLALPVPLTSDGGALAATLLQEITADPEHQYYPGTGACQTNTFAALRFASELEALKDPTRGNYAMLITDGEATCQNEGRWPLTGNLDQIDTLLGEMAAAGLPTFVIGFGDAVDPIALSRHAVAAGTQRDAEPAYYQAGSATELEEAISAIASSIVSCDFSLDSAPPNQEELYVFFNDDEQLPQDEGNGWVLSEQTISFRGSACDRLRNHEVEDVDVVFGCAQPVTK